MCRLLVNPKVKKYIEMKSLYLKFKIRKKFHKCNTNEKLKTNATTQNKKNYLLETDG